jgi:hypothetical protein
MEWGTGWELEHDNAELERSGDRCGDMSARIKLAETAEERDQVFRFRYQIYVEEMRRVQKHVSREVGTKPTNSLQNGLEQR